MNLWPRPNTRSSQTPGNYHESPHFLACALVCSEDSSDRALRMLFSVYRVMARGSGALDTFDGEHTQTTRAPLHSSFFWRCMRWRRPQSTCVLVMRSASPQQRCRSTRTASARLRPCWLSTRRWPSLSGRTHRSAAPSLSNYSGEWGCAFLATLQPTAWVFNKC